MKSENKPSIWRLAGDCLHNSIPVALLIVAESRGSTPGRAGFKMAVAADGRLAGTIGGGIIEQKFVEQARQKLKHADTTSIIRRQIHDQRAGADCTGMICGGSQTIILYPCRKSDLTVIEYLANLDENKGRAILRLSPSSLFFIPEQHNDKPHDFQMEAENEWLYEENMGCVNTVYIIGGGHIGQALSRVLAMLDFHIVILDERTDIDAPEANETLLVSYGDIQPYISDGEQNYAVIMTSNHKTDKLVLKQLLNKQLFYLSMMGSNKKVNEIFAQLRQEGIPTEILATVYAPVGLPIKSHTPAEIAVSIAAEIISLKNTRSY
jgi:xanthine dehydrogenase accessory factor